MHDDILITDMASFAFRAIKFCRELPSSDPRRFLDDVSIKRFEALPEHSPSLEENVRKCFDECERSISEIERAVWKLEKTRIPNEVFDPTIQLSRDQTRDQSGGQILIRIVLL